MIKTPPLSRSFAWLNATQFLGALNDNLFKMLLTLFIVHRLGAEAAARIGAVAMGLFVMPFLIFATTGGYMADRFPKNRVTVWTKVMEVGVMTLGCVAFWTESPAGLFMVLFLMATQSALFGPSKYGILPELVGKENLSKANSLLEAFSYLAIILGSALAPALAGLTFDRPYLAGLVCIGVAVTGFLVSLRIEFTPAVATRPTWSPLIFRDVWRTLDYVRRDRELLLAILASAYFLLLAAFVQIQIIPYGMLALGLNETQSGYLFLLVALGIGVGALLAGRLSGQNVEFGLVPLGALALTLSAFGLSALRENQALAFSLMLIVGLGSGLFVVPVQAFIQHRSPRERIGEILAASSVLSWLGVLGAAVLAHFGSDPLHLSARQSFFLVGVLTLALTVISVKVLPDFLIRFISLMLARLCYRIKVVGLENYPPAGPALLVSNHVSWADALLLSVLRPRRIRFIMSRDIYDHRWCRPLFRLMGVIPISFTDSPKKIVEALRTARASLDEGRVVCIFAEGAISRNGMLRGFRPGLEHIVKHSEVPIVPVYLGGLWGSIFSYYRGKLLSGWPSKFPYPVTILFGKALPAASSAFEVRQAVLELSCDYFQELKPARESVANEFIRAARKNWGRRALNDSLGKQLSFGQALTASLLLGQRIAARSSGQERIGLLLPTSVGGALANLAVILLGKVAVNLNFTSSAAAFASAVQQCELQTIISSRAFLEKLKGFDPPAGIVFIEDLLSGFSRSTRLAAFLKARLAPRRFLAPRRHFHPDDVLTIIFSSGSTGEPKGVMLSHHNILSNIEALRMVFKVSAADNVCGVLPFFHSFGYTGCIWFPLLNGFSASYHPNPVESASVARVIRENRSTIFFATPTFLGAYLRKVTREDFQTLRVVVAGAEKLKNSIADAFQEKIGIRPLEGYGATECSPVIALNIPDVVMDGVTQVGTREGSVGHPLPGVATKAVEPVTGAPLPANTAGLLLVKGPNVMRGYLGQPEKTAEVIRDGWYNTGDIAAIDPDGFITITDRLSRFSKIGGEMVPHLAIEEVYYRRLERSETVLTVTSVPDDRKGERLVVLYTEAAGAVEDLHRFVTESDLPNLWKPSRDNYFKVDQIPVLGSGKLDLSAARQAALKAVQEGT